MGSRSEISSLLSQLRWGQDEGGSYIGPILKREFLPVLAKVSHGSYAGGALSPGTHVLLISAGSTLSLVAQCVKFKTGRPCPLGPHLLIPSSYPAHFDILNEEGKSVPNLLSVQGLASLALVANNVQNRIKALVREPFKGLIAEGDEKTYRIGGKSKNLVPGELLTIVGVVSVPSRSKHVAKYLRVLDGDGATIFLPCNTKGKFSPVATVSGSGGVDGTGGEQDSIGGVHTTRGILSKRLPLMVRLVEGRPPSGGGGGRSSFKFFPDLRIYSSLKLDQLLFALPLTPSWKESVAPALIPLPASAPLKFQVARNMDEMEGIKSFTNLVHRAGCLLLQVKDRIQIYDMSLQKELPRFDGRQWKAYAPPIFLHTSDETPAATAAASTHPSKEDDAKEATVEVQEEEEECYQDIDELYDYVRGVSSSKPSAVNKSSTSTTLVTITSSGPDVIAHVNNNNKSSHQKPPQSHNLFPQEGGRLSPPLPPPIETIPSRCNNNINNKIPKRHSHGPSAVLVASDQQQQYHHHHHHHHHHHGTQIQIQIGGGGGGRSEEQNKNAGGIVITTTRMLSGGTEGDKNRALDSTGCSPTNSTTPTNTCSSSATTHTSSSSSSNGQSSNKGRTGLYIKKHSSNNGNMKEREICSGFRRSPMFDCRYKSLTELNNPLASPGGGGGGGLYTGKGSLTNLNKLSLNMGHGFGGGRPKSLNNIFAMDDVIHHHPHPTHHPHSNKSNFRILSGSGSTNKAPTHHHPHQPPLNVIVHAGVRKRLAELVMPSGGSGSGKMLMSTTSSSSQRSARHFRKASIQHSALFL